MKFKKRIKVVTEDFWYDIFEGGYIIPEEIIDSKEDLDKVNNAIEVLESFYKELDEKGLIELR